MYSKLIFKINKKNIEFKLHEILQIAISLINEKEWKLMLKNDVKELSSMENTVILEGESASIYQGGHYVCNDYKTPCQFEVDQRFLTERNNALNDDKLTDINEQIIQSILTQAQIKKAPQIMDPITHDLTLSLVKESSFIFANDLQFLRPILLIPPIANEINKLPKWLYIAQYYRKNYLKHPLVGWWVEIAGHLLLIKNTKDYGYYISDHGFLKDIVRGVEEIAFEMPWTNPEFVLMLMKAQQEIATNSQNPDTLKKEQNELVQSFITESAAVVQRFNPSLSQEEIQEDQQELAQRLAKTPSLAQEYWNNSIEAITYIINPLVRRFMEIKYTPYHPDSPFYQCKDSDNLNDGELGKDFQRSLYALLEDEPERVDEMVRTIVLASLARDINKGNHQGLLRPMFSYGDKDKGAPYHQFAASAVEYMAKMQLSDQKLAELMRQILTDNLDNDPDLGFLINLVSAWFIPETARNPLSVLTGIMMIDMIENNISLITNGVNIYTLQYALVHPDNDTPEKKVTDLCGKETTAWKIGGAHPMTHAGSELQARLSKKGQMTELTVVRQKEGRLLLHWLFIHLNKYLTTITNHNIQIEIVDSSVVPVTSKNLIYSEIAFNKKTANKLDKGGNKIDKEALLLKQNIQWYLLEPLLELRLNFSFNLLTEAQGLKFFEGILNKFNEAPKDNKFFDRKYRYALHSHVPKNKVELSCSLYNLIKTHEESCISNDRESDMDEYLSSLGLTVQDVPSEGNCFFHAVRDQLQTRMGRKCTVENLRFAAANYIIEYPQEFNSVLNALSFRNSEKYLQKLFENKGWANNLIVVALPKALNIKLVIIQNDEHIYSIEDENSATVFLGFYKNLRYISLHGTPVKNILENQPQPALVIDKSDLNGEKIQAKDKHSERGNNDIDSFKLAPKTTKGEGDCLFHAIFGKLNVKEQKIICTDVKVKRKQVADAVRNCKSDNPLFALIQDSVKAVVMGNESVKGLHIKDAQKDYEHYQKNSFQLMQIAWGSFEVILNKNNQVIDTIEHYCLEKKPEVKCETLRSKFNTCLNGEESYLMGHIFSLPDLHEAYKEYVNECEKNFNWEGIFNNPSIINEYANFIELPGQWLLHVDAHIIAQIFNITVEFYTKDANNIPVQYDICNPQQAETVTVCFDGCNHYEQMSSKEFVKSVKNSIAIQKPNIALNEKKESFFPLHEKLNNKKSPNEVLQVVHKINLNNFSTQAEKLTNTIEDYQQAGSAISLGTSVNFFKATKPETTEDGNKKESSISEILNNHVDYKNSRESGKILEINNIESVQNANSFFNENRLADCGFFNEFSDDFNDFKFD